MGLRNVDFMVGEPTLFPSLSSPAWLLIIGARNEELDDEDGNAAAHWPAGPLSTVSEGT